MIYEVDNLNMGINADFDKKTFAFIYVKQNNYYATLHFRFWKDESNYFIKTFTIQVDGKEIIDLDRFYDVVANKDYLSHESIKVFNREKEKVFCYNLKGNVTRSKNLPNTTRFLYSQRYQTPHLMVGESFINDPHDGEENQIQNKDLKINTFSSLFDPNIISFSQKIITDLNKIYIFSEYLDYEDNNPITAKKIESPMEQIAFGCPLFNMNDGVYLASLGYILDKNNERTVNYYNKLDKILDRQIDKDEVLCCNDELLIYGAQESDNYNLYLLNYKNHDLSFHKDTSVLINRIINIPGQLKWKSSYGDVFCTDKGIFTYPICFDETTILKPKYNGLNMDINEYPYVYLTSKGNAIYDKVASFYERYIEDYFIGVFFLACIIGIFLFIKFMYQKSNLGEPPEINHYLPKKGE